MGFPGRFASRIQCFAVDSGLLPTAAALERALFALGADSLGHANSQTLYVHLLETRRILDSWGQSPTIQMAGQFHSVYSTAAYRKQLLSYKNRPSLRALIGTDAENLVYLFSVLSYSTVFKAWKALNEFSPHDVITLKLEALSIALTQDELKHLLILHMANMAEQTQAGRSGKTSILNTLANLSRNLEVHSIPLPECLVVLAEQMTHEREQDLNEAYRVGLHLALEDPRSAVRELAVASNLCPILAEPLLLQSFLVGQLGDKRRQIELAEIGLLRLETFGVCWDKRKSFEEWRGLAKQLLNDSADGVISAQQFLSSVEAASKPEVREPLGRPFDLRSGNDRFTQYLCELRPGAYPGLSKLPWWSPSEFPIAHQLEDAYPEIRRETERLESSSFHREGERIKRTGAWDIFMFYERGKRIDANCDLCPTITRIIETNDTVRTIAGLIYLSRLAPGTEIETHTGLTNLRLRCHLGIQIPKDGDCGLEVAGETQRWTEGKCLIFDDYLPHRAWNWSGQDRIVLIIDLWHPELSPEEQKLIRGLHTYTANNAPNLVKYWAMNENNRFGKRHGYD